MLTKKDLLPLLEHDTLKKIAREYEVETDLRSVPMVLSALGKSKAVDVFHMLLHVSETDKASIANKFAIPLDGYSSFHSAVMMHISRQLNAKEMQEFYEYVYHHNFELFIESSNRGIVLANDETKTFLLYPAEVRKLIQILKKINMMRGSVTSDLIGNDHLLYSKVGKNGFTINELTTGFTLNKKRLSKEDTPCKDTNLSLKYSNVPYRCIVLTLNDISNGKIISRVAFKVRALDEVIQRLEGII